MWKKDTLFLDCGLLRQRSLYKRVRFFSFSSSSSFSFSFSSFSSSFFKNFFV